MTIKIPEPNILDKILKLFGKKRGFVIPKDVYQKFGPYVYGIAKRESFWKALLRSKYKEDSADVINLDSIIDSDCLNEKDLKNN